MDIDSIYRLYFRDVFLFLQGLTHNEALAEELTQETFFKALDGLKDYDDRQDVRAWLFTVARNAYYSHCRRTKRTAPLEDAETAPADTPDIAQLLVDQDAAKLLAEYAPQTVINLERMGVAFSRTDDGHIAQRRVFLERTLQIGQSENHLVDTISRHGLDILLFGRISEQLRFFPCLFVRLDSQKHKHFVKRRFRRYFLHHLVVTAIQRGGIDFRFMINTCIR